VNIRSISYACAAIFALCALGAAGAALAPRAPSAPAAVAQNIPVIPSATTTPDVYPVVHVMDGDTLAVLIGGSTTTIRVLGLDTPETVDPRKPIECFGPEASAEAHKILDGEYVRLQYDPSQDALDKYGRTLAYVYLPDGTLYDEFMIARGYGHEYTFKTPYEYQKEFRAAQAEAKKEQLGLWSPATCDGNTGITSHEPQ
jgi:micrococcal nuclease